MLFRSSAANFAFLGVVIFLVTLTGCGNPLGGKNSQVDTNHNPGGSTTEPLAVASGTDFVSSSSQGLSTANGKFILSGSLSNSTDKILMKSNTRNYKVFSSVQGELLSGGSGL